MREIDKAIGLRLTFGQSQLNENIEHWNYVCITNIMNLAFKKKSSFSCCCCCCYMVTFKLRMQRKAIA